MDLATSAPRSSPEPEMDNWPSWRVLAVVLSLAIVLRIVFFAVSSGAPDERRLADDSRTYLGVADGLARGYGFARERETEDGPRWVPELFRTPGYPAIIALVQRTTGSPRTGAIVLQHLLGVGLCGLLTVVCTRGFGRRAGLGAGCLSALDVQGIALGNLVLTGSTYGFVLVLCVLATTRLLSRPSIAVAVGSGALIGASCLIRPTSIALPIVVGVFLLARGFHGRHRRLAIAGAIVVITGYAVIGAWVVRNGRAAGDYTISSAGRFQLLFCHVAETVAWARGEKSREPAFAELLAELDLQRWQLATQPLSAEQKGRIRQLALRTIGEHPGAFVVNYTVKTANLLLGFDKLPLRVLGLPEPSLGFLNPRARRAAPSPLAASILLFEWLHLVIVYGLVVRAGRGILRARRAAPLTWVALLYALYVLGVSAGSPGVPRYRWPIIPLMIVAGVSSLGRSPSSHLGTSPEDQEVAAPR